MAHVLQNLGLKKALVVHGEDGLDEITTTAKTFASEYNGQNIISYEIDPSSYGISRALPQDLKGGGVEANAQIISDVLSGQAGPRRDIVLLNAAHALYIAGKASTVSEGLEAARRSIDTKKAKEKFDSLIAFTNQ